MAPSYTAVHCGYEPARAEGHIVGVNGDDSNESDFWLEHKDKQIFVKKNNNRKIKYRNKCKGI